MSARPVVGHDDRGPVFHGECRRHGWHGRSVCQKCLPEPHGGQPQTTDPVHKLVPSRGEALNAKYRPGNEIVAFGMTRRRFWTDSTKPEREGHCRMCMRPARVRQLTRHHLIPQWWWMSKGDIIATLRNAAANIVPLCRACHDGVETDRAQRRMLRRVLTQTEVAFCIDVRDRGWFDSRYPS